MSFAIIMADEWPTYSSLKKNKVVIKLIKLNRKIHKRFSRNKICPLFSIPSSRFTSRQYAKKVGGISRLNSLANSLKESTDPCSPDVLKTTNKHVYRRNKDV